MLGYYPPNHPRDGRFHKIEVRVKRPGLRVLGAKGLRVAAGAHVEQTRDASASSASALARTKGADQTSSELRAMLEQSDSAERR